MNRFLVVCSALLLFCCFASAQQPASAPASAPATSTATSTATSAESPEIRQFQKIEDNWADSVNQRDQYGLELVLSPLFVDVSANGEITTRNQQLAQVITGEDKTIKLEQRVITVRMLGDIAVINGTYTLHHKVNSSPLVEKGVFTHVFERLRGGWVCINSQRTLLREETTVKPKKQSTAELPFHIPLFTKSDKGPQQ